MGIRTVSIEDLESLAVGECFDFMGEAWRCTTAGEWECTTTDGRVETYSRETFMEAHTEWHG